MPKTPRVFPGDKFGRWMADGSEFRRGKRLYVPVTCACGIAENVLLFQLESGRSQSCGCLKRDKLRERLTTHGMSGSPEFWVWVAMRERCHNPKHEEYHNYGGRGVVVCESWRSDFSVFFLDVGRRPSKKHSLDRYPNNNGNSEPGNVRWTTQREQTRNMRRNVLVEHEGKTWCFTDLAEHLGVNGNTARVRMHRGMTPREALGI